MNKLFITRELLDKIISHCREDYPNEACGILGGRGNTIKKVYKAVNMHNSSVTFRIEPFQILRNLEKDGLEMIAVYHSHPHSQAYPSLIDAECASEPDSTYVSMHVIISLACESPELRVFSIENRTVMEIPLIVL